MAIQSNQPSMSWVLVGSRCPWSKLMKSRGIVHPGERESWAFVLWRLFVRCFEEILRVFFGFLRGVGPKNGELQASGKLFFVFQATVYSSLMYFLFICTLHLKISLLPVLHPSGAKCVHYIASRCHFLCSLWSTLKFNKAQCACFPPCCRHAVMEKECRNECIDLCLSLPDRSRWGTGSFSLADGLY